MRPLLVAAFIGATVALAMPGAASAADARGLWLRSDGAAQIRIAPCGALLCGTVAWVKDPRRQGEVGRKVLYDMEAAGAGAWEGKAFNPEDGRTYSGRMTVDDARLTTQGCALGGLICKSIVWARVKE